MRTIITPIALSFIFFIPVISLCQVAATVKGISAKAQYPTCATDEWNQIQSQKDAKFAADLKYFKEVVVPHLASIPLSNQENQNIITIPTVVHIIHSGEPIGQGQNLSEGRILAQMEVLNEDFAALNPEFPNTPAQWSNILGTPNIQFCLATIDPDGNPTDGIDRQQFAVTGTDWQNNNIKSEIKPALNWDPDKYFNIYVLPIPGTTAQGGVVGFSNFPTPFQIGSPTDGPVVDYRWFGGPGYGQSGYRTITHETGHYLGAPHPFEGNSCNQDDGISDTPNVEEPTRNLADLDCANSYPAGPLSCGNEHLYVNYMDYTNENCYTSFTIEQGNVMRAVLDGTSSGFGYGSRKPLADHAAIACILAENDAGILEIIEPIERFCSNDSIAPTVKLRNFGTEALNSVYIAFQIDDENPDTLFWEGNLVSGSNLDVTLGNFEPPTGAYDFTAYTFLPNDLADDRVANDTMAVGRVAFHPVPAPVIEDLENENTFPTMDGYFSLQVNPLLDDFFWVIAGGLSAYGVGEQCLWFNNYDEIAGNNPFGTTDAMISPHFDLTNITDAQLTFDVAYAPFDNDPSGILGDTLIILAASECSTLFSELLYFQGGEELATAPPTADFFIPQVTQWRSDTLDLSMYDGVSDLTLAFINFSGWGNNLFIDNIKVGSPCAMTLSFDSENATCANECDGMATVTAAGGGDSLMYEWSDGQNTQTSTDLCAGTYEVTVTDENGCSAVSSIEIEEPPVLTAIAASTDETANDANDGTATVNPIGGNGDYTYLWSDGQNTQSATNLPPGTYSVTVTDSKDCQTIAMTTVEAFDCGSFGTSVQSENVSCFGQSDGSASVTPVGGSGPYTYEWSNGDTGPQSSGLTAGTYTATVIDGFNCPATATVNVTQPEVLVANVSATHESANGANDGTASVSISGGTNPYSVLWTGGQTSSDIENLPPGNYSVTVTDENNCTATASVTVNSFDCGGFGASISSTNISCFGAKDGTAQVTGLSGAAPFSFAWNVGLNDQSILNLTPGTYRVTVTDANGCGTVLETTVSEPTVLILNLAFTHETGSNSNNGTASANVSGGTQPYNYQWSNGMTTNSISNLSPGNYGVTVTDENGCTSTQNFTIEAFECALSVDLNIENATCPNGNDGAASVTMEGGTVPYDITWSNGASGPAAYNLEPGFYIVTVVDANNCDHMQVFQIMGFDNVGPQVLVQNIVIGLDGNGMANITPQMIDAGSSDNCGIESLELNQTDFDCADIGDNAVALTVTDVNGNQAFANATVTVVDNQPPVLTFCPDDMVFFDCESVLTYDLPQATDNCDIIAIELISGIGSGGLFPNGTTIETYRLTDGGGNVVECGFSITLEYDLEADFEVIEPTCSGFSDGAIVTDATGGVPPYSFQISGGADPANLPAGTYSITIMDSEACAIVETIVVGEPEPLSIQIDDVTDATNGSGGSIEFSVEGGVEPFTFEWYLDGTLLTDVDPNDLAPGEYVIIVTDDNGCQISSNPVIVDDMVGTDDLNLENLVKIYPNPSGGEVFVTLEMPRTNWVEIVVLDVNGKQIMPLSGQLINDHTFLLDLSNQSAGVYLLRILIGEELVTKRVVYVKD